jgi:hypothetical protein
MRWLPTSTTKTTVVFGESNKAFYQTGKANVAVHSVRRDTRPETLSGWLLRELGSEWRNGWRYLGSNAWHVGAPCWCRDLPTRHGLLAAWSWMRQ